MRVHMAKSRELSKHGYPVPKRSRVIQVSTSEEAAEESEHIDHLESWRYVDPEAHFFHFGVCAHVCGATASVVQDVVPNASMSTPTPDT